MIGFIAKKGDTFRNILLNYAVTVGINSVVQLTWDKFDN